MTTETWGMSLMTSLPMLPAQGNLMLRQMIPGSVDAISQMVNPNRRPGGRAVFSWRFVKKNPSPEHPLCASSSMCRGSRFAQLVVMMTYRWMNLAK